MGLLHPDMKAALAQKKAFAVFEFDDPGSTTHRYAIGPTSSDSLGKYKGFIPRGGFGPSPRSVPLRGDGLEPISTHVTVIDHDGAINDLVTGQYSRQIRGLDARIRLVAEEIPAEAYHLRFKGQIVDYGKSGQAYRFELGPKLAQLEGLLKVPVVTRALWPDADGSAIGKPAPLIYGVHSSADLGSRGMLPTLYVDKMNHYYLPSHQYIKDITNVYVDHIVQASGWSKVYLEREGQRYTLVKFTTDQGNATITVDAKGGVYTGDPTSYDEFTNPATALKYILANYAFHSWDGKPANWHDETDSPIEQGLLWLVEQFFNSRGVKGSIAISEQMTGFEFLNLWASEYVPVFWTPDAKVGVRTDDWYFTPDTWNISRTRITENEHFLEDSPFKYDFSSELLADEWDVGFLYSEAESEALERIRMKDTLRGWHIGEPIDLKLSESTV